jgi:transketolase
LYARILKVDSDRPDWPDRDYFILSKGHSSVGLYAALHLSGFMDRATFMTFRQNGSLLGGHPVREKVAGVEMSTGSLGHGLSIGAGLALAFRKGGRKNRVFVMVGDGESQEGSVWEAAMFAGHYALDNMVLIVDRNGLQIDGNTETLMRLEPLADKWRAFNWDVRVINGHDIEDIVRTFDALSSGTGRPVVVIANTIKGKGISFMENNAAWHGGAPGKEQAQTAMQETMAAVKALEAAHG